MVDGKIHEIYVITLTEFLTRARHKPLNLIHRQFFDLENHRLKTFVAHLKLDVVVKRVVCNPFAM